MSNQPRSDQTSSPFDRSEVAAFAAVAVLGALWGAAWQRSAALSDIAAVAPVMLVVIGPGLLVGFVGMRVATGRFEARTTGLGTAIALLAALVGNQLTPGLTPSIEVTGAVSGTLDGTPVNATATCVWGPGRTAVIRVTAPIPKGFGNAMFSKNLPGGTIVLEMPAGSMAITDITVDALPSTMPLRTGSGDVGTGDRATGTVTLVGGQGAIADGQLSWTCSPAPAS